MVPNWAAKSFGFFKKVVQAMPGTIRHHGSEETTLADLCAGNSVTWQRVQTKVLPKVRHALMRRFGADRYGIDLEGAVQSGIREFLVRSTSAEKPMTLAEFECWLVVTAGRKLRDQSARKAESSRTAVEIDAVVELSPLEIAIAGEVESQIEQIFLKLDDAQRIVLRHWLEGSSQTEIAQAAGVTRSRVRTALAAAMAIARSTLAPETLEPGP